MTRRRAARIWVAVGVALVSLDLSDNNIGATGERLPRGSRGAGEVQPRGTRVRGASLKGPEPDHSIGSARTSRRGQATSRACLLSLLVPIVMGRRQVGPRLLRRECGRGGRGAGSLLAEQRLSARARLAPQRLASSSSSSSSSSTVSLLLAVASDSSQRLARVSRARAVERSRSRVACGCAGFDAVHLEELAAAAREGDGKRREPIELRV